jgi:hypothetical protein
MLERNDTLVEVLNRAARLDLPGWYVAAGCLSQTVWNVLGERPAGAGIKDYDLIYHDPADLSWEAEDIVIRAGAELFGDLPVPVEIRNEARVHLWYQEKFGVACTPYESTEAAIDTFPGMACGNRAGAARGRPADSSSPAQARITDDGALRASCCYPSVGGSRGTHRSRGGRCPVLAGLRKKSVTSTAQATMTAPTRYARR